jgi:Protein of unknown function (DUF1572)
MKDDSIGAAYLADAVRNLRGYKKLAEKAMDQVDEGDLFRLIDPEANSIAMLAKHMAGNMRSRWTDFLTSDGEKPDRNRDSEFEEPPATRSALMKMWEEGWKCLFDALEPLSAADVDRKVTIRGEAHSVMQAVNRQIAHYAYHVGQIVFLAKHLQHAGWKSLSIPRHQSAKFNQRVADGETSQR